MSGCDFNFSNEMPKIISYSYNIFGERRESILYHQCESCLAFIPASKWESHMEKCSSKTNIDCQSQSFRPVTFQDPVVLLKKLDEGVLALALGGKNLASLVNDERSGSSGEASTTEVRVAKKRGPRPKFFITTDKPFLDYPAELDLALKPRKSSLNAQDKLRKICGKSRLDIDTKEDCVPSLARDKAKKIPTTRTGRISKLAKRSQSKICIKQEPRILSKNLKDSYVRKYEFTCNLCSGKFSSVDAITAHIKFVHRGNMPVVPCCVCGEDFSQRDAYDCHILSHQNAEEREIKYDLLNPWRDDKSANPYHESCKYCLLEHFSCHSYITHLQEEHLDMNYLSHLLCKFESCEETFDNVTALIAHTKSVHHEQFYGTVTTLRVDPQTGAYISDSTDDNVINGTNQPSVFQLTATNSTSPLPECYSKPVKSYTAVSSPPPTADCDKLNRGVFRV